jgi:predicted nucleic acid-binding protein
LISLLDTNVISQRVKPSPHPGVLQWMRQMAPQDLFISAITLTEIRFGIEEMPPGQRRSNLTHWLTQDLQHGFAGRIIPVDEPVAEEAGRLISLGKRNGAKPELADALIAATARVHSLKLATLNTTHFKPLGVDFVKW